MTLDNQNIKGLDQLEINLGKVVGAVTGNDLAQALKAGYFVWEGKAKKLIATSPATGRKYGGHRASAPGEPPASDTGGLLNNWPTPKKNFTATGAEIEGGPGQEHASHLDLGTVKMDSRPFMRPALDENEAEIERAGGSILKMKIEGAL